MRNWYWDRALYLTLGLKLLPYLWGIDTDSRQAFFQSIGWLLPYLWGIDTLDCWVRNIRIYSLLPYLWGIDTARDAKIKKEWRPLTLPMRNWYLYASINAYMNSLLPYLWGIDTQVGRADRILLNLGLLPYLWGIDTFKSRGGKFQYYRLLPYLWGIDTPVSSLAILQGSFSYLTYEELIRKL